MGEALASVPADLTLEEAAAATRALAKAGPDWEARADHAARTLAALVVQQTPAMLQRAQRAGPDEEARRIALEHLDGVQFGQQLRLAVVMSQQLRAMQARQVGGNGGLAQHADSGGTDPVELYRGEFTHEATDMVVRGAGIDFAFHRTYRHQTVFDGPLGHRWDHGYNLFLQVNDISASLWTGSGRAENYQRHQHHTYYLPPDGSDATLEPLGPTDAPTGWVRRAPDGLRHVFEPEPGWSGAFRLTRIEDRWGNYLAFTYQDGRLDECRVNHDARRVRFHYDQEGRIVRVADHTGRAWRYVYDSHGDLLYVITPSTPSRKKGCVTEYRYSTAEHATGPLAHNLTDIFDAEGRHYLRNKYGTSVGMEDYNRVVYQRLAHGDFWFRYGAVDPVFDGELPVQDRPTMRVWVKERNGFQTLSIYNAWGGLLRKEETHRQGGAKGTRVVWRYRYNRDGQLVASRSPEGVVTHVLTGRDHFYRVHNIDPNVPGDEDGLWRRDALTADVRRGFGRVLATVNRARHHTATSFDWNDRWGDTYQVDAADIIVKYTYETTYGRPLTTSDPRTTTRPDPRAIEPPEYHRLLTRFEYEGTGGDPTRDLARVIAPTPTLPDGTLGAPVVTQILDRDERGRVRLTRDAVGTETVAQYLVDDPPDNAGPKTGFVKHTIADAGDPTAGHLNITTRFEFDDLGRVTATTLPRSVEPGVGRFVARVAYDTLDRVTVARGPTPLDFETRTRYGPAGKPDKVEVDWRDPDGTLRAVMVRRFKYNEEHQVVKETWGGEDIGRHFRIAHKYDAAGTLRFTMAANDTTVHFRYDSRDQLVKTIRSYGVPGESISVITRDKDGRVVTKRSGEGRTETYELDVFGRMVAVTDPLGHVTRTSYDKGSRPTVVRQFERRADGTFWLMARSEATYDELGRAVRSIANRFDEPLLATDPTTAYEAAPGPGRRVESQTFLDAAGRVVAVVNPLGNTTTSEYDAVGRIIRVTDALGNRVETKYDAHGNVVRKDRLDVVRDIAGNVTGQEVLTWTGTYDERDRLVTESDGLGNTSEYQYDSLDRRVLTKDPLGNISEVEYDVYGRMVATTERRTDNGLGTGDPLPPATVRLELDPSGNVRARIDALGRRTEYRYDRSNRVVEQIFPGADGARVVTRYDRDDLVTAVRDAHGVVVRNEYDAAGRLVRTLVDDAELDAGVVLEGARLVEHAYDGLDRLTSTRNEAAAIATRFGSLGHPLQEDTTVTAAGGLALRLERRFDDAGRLIGTTYSGGRQVRHDRDAVGRLRDLVHEADGADYPGANVPGPRALATFAYAGGRLRQVTRPNGTATAITHDGAGRRVELHHTGPTGTLLRVQQLHDAARNPRLRLETAATPTAPAPTTARPDRFGYDAQYQLTARADATVRPFADLTPFAPPGAPQAPVPHRQPLVDAEIGAFLPPVPTEPIDRWGYDLVGNRNITSVVDGTTRGYVPNDRDQYETVDGVTRSYDRAGNLRLDGRFEYRYDSWRRLCRVVDAAGADVVRYAYDPAGRRVVEDTVGAGALVIAHDGVDRVADYRTGVCVAQYVHGDAIDDPLHLATAGSEAWYHADQQGSVRALTDAGGATLGAYRFDPFGNLVEQSGAPVGPPGTSTGVVQPFGFGSRPFDPNVGLYDQRARSYSTSIGRFLQRDPGGAVDGTNLYMYAGNHPLAFGDVNGMCRSERSGCHVEPPISRTSEFERRFGPDYGATAISGDAETSLPDAPPIRTVSAARDLIHRFNRGTSPNPILWGITASDPTAGLHPVEHVINAQLSTPQKGGPSQWISGSRRPGGAKKITGDSVYIDVKAAQRAGVEFVDELPLAHMARDYADLHPEARGMIKTWLENQPNEREVVFRGDIPRKAVARPKASWFNKGARWLGRTSKVLTVYELGKASVQGCGSHADHAAARTDFRSGCSVRLMASAQRSLTANARS